MFKLHVFMNQNNIMKIDLHTHKHGIHQKIFGGFKCHLLQRATATFHSYPITWSIKST